MTASVELRVPYLDKAFTNFMQDMTSKESAKKGNKKVHLSSLAAEIYGQDFAYRKKQGFNLNTKEFVRANFRSISFELSNGLNCDLRSFINVAQIRNILKGAEQVQNSEIIYGIYFLNKWLNSRT